MDRFEAEARRKYCPWTQKLCYGLDCFYWTFRGSGQYELKTVTNELEDLKKQYFDPNVVHVTESTKKREREKFIKEAKVHFRKWEPDFNGWECIEKKFDEDNLRFRAIFRHENMGYCEVVQ